MKYVAAIAVFLIWSFGAYAQPTCTSEAPNAIACQSQAVNPQQTDIVLGQQATGPSRSNQTVKFSLSQLGSPPVGPSGAIQFNSNGSLNGSANATLGSSGNLYVTGLKDFGATFISSTSPTIPSTEMIALFDPTVNAISATIQPCNSGVPWDQWFKDATGESAIHTITLTPSSGTIDGSSSAQIGSAYADLHIHSNGGICVIL